MLRAPRPWLAALLAGALACAAPPAEPRPGRRVVTAPPQSDVERYCAWYGTADRGTFYFGQAPFWSAMHDHGGDPSADLLHSGPQPVGRFDLATESMLPPLEVGREGSSSGVWDVLVRGGRLYYTTFYEDAGWVELASGRVTRLDPDLAAGLNELSPGPGDQVLASRYGTGDDADGAVVAIDRRGRRAREWPLPAPAGYQTAPKTVAWDEARGEIWASTDLLPRDPARALTLPIRHDAYVVEAQGGRFRRIERPEIQFAAFGPDGTGYRAEVDGERLTLRVVPPPGSPVPERSLLLDDAFAPEYDFVQDIQPAADGRVAVMRWSGAVHVLGSDGRAHSAQLPQLDPEGLYYTAVLYGPRLCATYCADVTVVCVNAP